MAYSQGGKIDASDYNNLIGSDPTNASNTLNAVWGTGNGMFGYGQTAISQVSAEGTVTATQWATLINRLNSTRLHQTGSNAGLTAVVSGDKINYLSTLQTQVNNAYSSALTFASNSAVVTGSALTAAWTATIANPGSNPPAAQTSQTSLTRAFGVRLAWGSVDQTRYFFNSGGRFRYNVSGAQNASTTSRTNAIINTLSYLGGILVFASNSSGGRAGTGGTLGTNLTTTGYYQLTTSNVTHVSVTSLTSNYTADTGTIAVKTNGTAGSYNANGNNIDIWTTVTTNSGTDGSGGPYPTKYGFDDSFGVTVSQSIDVSYPEVTNLSNTWGAVTVTQL